MNAFRGNPDLLFVKVCTVSWILLLNIGERWNFNAIGKHVLTLSRGFTYGAIVVFHDCSV